MKEVNHPHTGHRQRLKDRFVNNGLDGFEDHKIIELLLFFGIPYKDTNEIAHELINQFGSVSGVMDANINQLLEIKGVSDHVATLIMLTRELAKKYAAEHLTKKEKFNCLDDAANYIMSKFMYLDHEKFGILGLDSNNHLKGFSIISEGSINATEVSIPLGLETVLSKKWPNIIICHNHPNGSLLPSNQDVATTIAFKQAMDIAGVNLIDHIIVNDYDYISMASSAAYKKIFTRLV